MNIFSRLGHAARFAVSGRLSASAFASGFEGAMRQRRLANWRATEDNINTLLTASGDTLRARGRQIVRANPYAANAAGSFVANAVGAGIKPSSLIPDATIKDGLQRLWLDWTDEADADGLTDFYGLEALAARAMFEAGECFVRFRPRLPKDGLSVPLQLQLLEAEHLPYNKNEKLSNGNQIRCGIEFDVIGRRVAYHFYRLHPGDSTELSNLKEIVRVPASEVLHLYRVERPGQIRGVPWVSPALVKLYLLDQYDDAELDRKKVAALFAGFITKTSPEDSLLGEGAPDSLGASVAGLAPGMMQVLLPGEDVKFAEPADVGGSYEMFQYRTHLAVAAALGMPYMNVTGDLKAANYSSIRAGTVEFRRRLEQFQHTVLIYQLCRPVWQRWLDTVALSDLIEMPNYRQDRRKYQAVKWITPKWDWVDPLKDRQAERIAQECGWKAPSDIIEAEGYDVDETFNRIASDQQRARDLGIQLGDPAKAAPEPVTGQPVVDPENETNPAEIEAA